MKFSTREDIEAPIDTVWAAVTDSPRFEQVAKGKGVEVKRHSEEAMDIGSGWTAGFEYRGIKRELEAVVTAFEAPQLLEMDSTIGSLDGLLVVELVELSERATRMTLSLDIKPNGLAGKMVIQTMKLARGKIDKRFGQRVHTFAKTIARTA